MNNKSCPISLTLVDANVARLYSLFVGILFTLFLVTLNPVFIYFLILDFSVKIFLNSKYSFLNMLGIQIKKIFHIQTNKVDGAPKKLAALFGLVFLIAIALTSTLKLMVLFYILSISLLVCIFLEVTISYCLGCEIYHLYKKIFV